ncbi:DUF5956 family protein [Arthrobacter sp. NPDC056691]|uniref:DUF5956 family protein n=1 Tax=unclassified Arthrobacter TaxID=235627 RepID=UPI003672A013
MWNDVQESEPSARWAELSENGWGALMGWAAGDGNLRRRRSSDAGRTVSGHTGSADWRKPFDEPFTAADRQAVDDDIDTFLRDAGLPPRPRGYVWMIRVPDSHATPEAFLADVDAAILRAADGIVDPNQLRPIFAGVLSDFYAGGG